MKVIIIIIATLLTSLYLYVAFCLENVELKSSLLPLIIEIIGSFLLALVVFLLGSQIEKNWREKTHKDNLENKLNLLRKQVKRMFKRHESSWNFNNTMPTFYFDKSYINSLYELLTYNNRKWEEILIDYNHSFNKKSKENLVNMLLSFLDKIENALIFAEQVDQYLKSKIIAPKLAAIKESGYSQDVYHGDITEPFNYLIYRAYLNDISETEIIMGLGQVPGVTDISKRVQRATSEIEKILTNNPELKSLIKKLKTYKKDVLKQVKNIRLKL